MTEEFSRPRLPLFEQVATSRPTDPATSSIAAEKINRNGVALNHERIVTYAVRQNPGLTPRELAEYCEGLTYAQARKRLGTLKRKKLIEAGLHRRCRILGSQCQTIWPFGRVPRDKRTKSPYQ